MSRLFAKVICPMLLLAAFVGVVVAPSHAEAKVKVPIPYNMGPYYFTFGKIKEVTVAWKCDHGLDVLWFNVAKFGCHIVILKEGFPSDADSLERVEDQYRMEVSAEAQKELEKKYPFSDLERSFWHKYGRWITLLVLIGAGILYLLFAKPENKEDESKPPGDKPGTETQQV